MRGANAMREGEWRAQDEWRAKVAERPERGAERELKMKMERDGGSPASLEAPVISNSIIFFKLPDLILVSSIRPRGAAGAARLQPIRWLLC